MTTPTTQPLLDDDARAALRRNGENRKARRPAVEVDELAEFIGRAQACKLLHQEQQPKPA